MNGLTSTNWNNSYGMENPKNILNKVISHGALPINQNYVFFNNGGAKFINDSKLTPEIQKALEDERIKRGRGPIHGSGTIRPLGYSETEMSDLFYNSYGLDFRIGSIPPFLDILTIALLVFGVGSLAQLLAAFYMYQLLSQVLRQTFYSFASFQLPKLGFCDLYGYQEQPPDPKSILKIINRAYPFTKDGKLPDNKLINLSSEAAFRKITGNSSYDTTLSKYQFNGGGGFSTDLRGEQMEKYIDNLLGNLTVEKSQIDKLKKFFPKDSAAIETAQKDKKALLELMKTKTNLGSNYIHADFLDYVPVLLSSKQKGYPNKEKEKSIFGPYICRSKKAYLYYPKIIITTPVVSTLNSPQYAGMQIDNYGFSAFGGFPELFSAATADMFGEYIGLIFTLASMGTRASVNGYCNILNKDQAFNLGAAFNQKTQLKPKSDGC
jgi:hypothetical protein